MDDTPHVSLVATTRILQRRIVANPQGTCTADGGHGFSIFGWPMIIKGELNPHGQLAPTELMITSTMKLPHVAECFNKAAASAEEVTHRSPNKAFTMSDAEQALMQPLRDAHQAHSAMCGFHVFSATREYLLKHARVPLDQRRLLFLSKVRPDIWCLQRSLNELEFQTKSKVIMKEWQDCGLAHATAHYDGNGDLQDIVVYFRRQWLQLVSCWFAGISPARSVASTNNAVESTIKYTRQLAGGAPCGAIQLAKFMLQNLVRRRLGSLQGATRLQGRVATSKAVLQAVWHEEGSQMQARR
jgi:hypothetical protein